jgi:carbonic anhydrase
MFMEQCDHEITQNSNATQANPERRSLLKTVCGVTAAGMVGSFAVSEVAFAAALTKEERDKMTPDEIIASMKKGNKRFRAGKPDRHDYLAQKRASVAGQFPSAIILSCIDSRAPAEIVLDLGIGEAFVTRAAGNISNDDILGGMEFACAASGAKVIVVMGHTGCGAVRGAIDGVKLGNLTGLLDKIKPAISETTYSGERVGSNYQFVDAVAKTNVRLTIENIRKGSQILRDLEKDGKLKIVGAMYTLNGGRVEFF